MDSKPVETGTVQKTWIAIYVRVSTKDQEDNSSLSHQEQTCRKACYDRGFEVYGIYADIQSGSDDDRPGLQTLMQDIESGENINGVIVARVDRLSRDCILGLTISKKIIALTGLLIAVDLPIPLNTAYGWFMLTIMFGFAELERILILQRTQSGREEKEKQGVKWGAPEYGKHKTPEGVQVCYEEVKLIEDIKKLRRQGFSLRQIATELNRRGIPPKRGKQWQHSTVAKILHRVKK